MKRYTVTANQYFEAVREDDDHGDYCLFSEADSELRELRERCDQLEQLIIDANHVAKERFEYHGLCDALDNNGRPYPSQWCADLVKSINKTPIMSLQDALAAEKAKGLSSPGGAGGQNGE